VLLRRRAFGRLLSLGELGPDQESHETAQHRAAEPAADRATGIAGVGIIRLPAHRQAQQYSAHGAQAGADCETLPPVVRRAGPELLMEMEVGAPEALSGRNDGNRAGWSRLDPGDRS
jgi:hypothetical protein